MPRSLPVLVVLVVAVLCLVNLPQARPLLALPASLLTHALVQAQTTPQVGHCAMTALVTENNKIGMTSPYNGPAFAVQTSVSLLYASSHVP